MGLKMYSLEIKTLGMPQIYLEGCRKWSYGSYQESQLLKNYSIKLLYIRLHKYTTHKSVEKFSVIY